ncbi:MAG: DUF167 family protein [Pikeienuella sp.]|uniref:DUF167 family protein n=1 Tax=Pikeienuella sp. TaxID=2831957 RepID=UPI00391AC903
MSGARPWRPAPGGLSLRVRVTPRGGADRIEGLGADAAGAPVLLVRVSAPPADGAANKALVRLVAKAAGVPKGAVTVEAGAAARIKRLHIAGEAAALEASFVAAFG